MSTKPTQALTNQMVTDTGHCICFADESRCMCPPQERILRNVIAGQIPALTDAQREWCKSEIVSVEGYDEKDAEGDDVHLAQTVLSAWTDYCRDKGMI